jgi:HSF-type DNA-binding
VALNKIGPSRYTLPLFLIDGRYESLRRQMNVYGFRKDPEKKWWSRKGDLFHRDRPEDLEKVRPRPRDMVKTRPSRSKAASEANSLHTCRSTGTQTSGGPKRRSESPVSIEKISEKKSPSTSAHSFASLPEGWTTIGYPSDGRLCYRNENTGRTSWTVPGSQIFSSPKNKRESTVSSDNPWVHVKGSMVAEAEGEKRKLTKSSSPRSEAVAKSTRIRMCTTSSNPISGAADKPTDSSSSDSISLRSKGSVIHTEFPALLHRFIDECAVTHPDIVEWNNTFTGFNVEIHHPQLPNLLLKYFRRT